jgi:hypothetical protein
VFAGLRSDPFILAWLFRGNTMTPVPNLLEHDNVLCIVVEFDTRHVLAPERGSLFAVIAETTPLPRPGGSLGNPPPRFDWVGRPEQTNMRLDNPGMAGRRRSSRPLEPTDAVCDWGRVSPPFSPTSEGQPCQLGYARRQGGLDTLRAGRQCEYVSRRLLLFDVTKPITDTSHLEIEKSTLNGKAYEPAVVAP